MRVLLLLLALLLAWQQYTFWFGSGGQRDVAELRARVAAQKRENARFQQRNEALLAEVEDLKSGAAAVEERARSELGMVKPGEVFYRVVETGGAAQPVRQPLPDAPAGGQ